MIWCGDGSGRRGRLISVAGACGLVMLVAGGPAMAQATRGAATRYGKPLAPRVVHPHQAPPGRMLGRVGHTRGEVPTWLGRGKPATGLPPTVSDAHTGSGGSLAAPSALNTQSPFVAPGALTASGSFAELLGLTGVTAATSSDGEPPDTQMAAGQNEVVEVVNSEVFVYSRAGALLTSYPLSNIFQPPTQSVGLSDPKIVFDPTTGDYYLLQMVCQNAQCGANNWTHMGISLAVTGNPQGSWTVYDYLNDGQDLQDQPKLGFSGDKITFAVNEYGCKCGAGTSFKQANLIVIQKSDAVAGNPLTPAVYSDASKNSNSTYL